MNMSAISLDDLEAALLEQERLSRLNLHFRLGEILVSQGALTVDDVLGVLAQQGKRILVCESCDAHYNVVSFEDGKAYRCSNANVNLPNRSNLDTVAVDALI